ADVAVGRLGQTSKGILEDLPALLQPGEQGSAAAGAALGRHPLLRRHHLRPLGQMLDAEQLAADRAGKEILSDIRAKAGREHGERAAQAGRNERTSLKAE